MLTQIRIATRRKNDWIQVTAEVREAIRASGISEGLCVVFCPHTTAGITVNENADPDVVRDLTAAMDRAFPDHPGFRHVEGNSAAHAKAMATGSSVTLPVAGGQPMLGTWQGIWFCEFDGPRQRTLQIKVIRG